MPEKYHARSTLGIGGKSDPTDDRPLDTKELLRPLRLAEPRLLLPKRQFGADPIRLNGPHSKSGSPQASSGNRRLQSLWLLRRVQITAKPFILVDDHGLTLLRTSLKRLPSLTSIRRYDKLCHARLDTVQ